MISFSIGITYWCQNDGDSKLVTIQIMDTGILISNLITNIGGTCLSLDLCYYQCGSWTDVYLDTLHFIGHMLSNGSLDFECKRWQTKEKIQVYGDASYKVSIRFLMSFKYHICFVHS